MDQWASIRQLAARVLEEYQQRSGRAAFGAHNGIYAMLPDLAERCFGLTVLDDPSLPAEILGCLNREEGTITYHPALSPQRAAFVVAHEIGHCALNHPPREISPDDETNINEQPHGEELRVQDNVLRAYHERDRRELEANIFAAELLAPLHQVRAKVLLMAQWRVEELSKYFGLSSMAMTNQLAAALFQIPASQEHPTENTPLTRPPLDARQQEAVEVSSPALVVAGPGAGKTRVLVERFAHLVRNGASPRRILALTFSNKAAGEMRERLATMLPEQAHEIEVTTFHALGLQLLLGFGTQIGLRPDLQIRTPVEIYVWLRNRLSELPLGHFENLNRPTQHLQTLLNVFSRAKDELVGPAEFALLVEQWQQELAASEADEEAMQAAVRCADVAEVYAVYQQWLHEAGYVDYGDLITESVRLFEVPAVADAIRSTFDHILVDEMQDINYASGRLVQALDGGRGIVWAVGDPRQSIYGFRGASRANLQQFSRDYPGAQIIALDVNYRSVEAVVQAGQAIPFPAEDGDKILSLPVLRSQRGRRNTQPAVTIVVAATKQDEVAAVVEQTRELLQEVPLSSIAILCRRRDKAHQIAQALEADGIPTTWQGQPEDNPLLKDLLSVLLAVNDEVMGLLRLARLPEHHLEHSELNLLIAAANAADGSLRIALQQAIDGELNEFSDQGIHQAQRLTNLITSLEQEPTPWHMLAAYLFRYSRWPRQLWREATPAHQRDLNTIGQLLNLAREWSRQAARNHGDAGASLAEFVEFVRTSLEAGELHCPTSPLPNPDAVQVLTMHGSKGLEWPVVIIPDCVENTRTRPELPLPPRLFRDGSAPDDEHERAALFYVAITRARDRLILTHATKQGRQKCTPLPFLKDLRRVLQPAGTLQEKDFEPTVSPAAEPPRSTGKSFQGRLSYRALVEFEECSQRFKYRYVDGLSSGSQSYRGFHHALYETLNWVARGAAAGTVPDGDAAAGYFSQQWQTDESPHPFEPLYQRYAERIIASFLQRVRPGDRIRFRQSIEIPLEGRSLQLTLDEIEEGTPRILRRHHFGQPATRHREEHLPALLQAAYGQIDANVSIRLHYPLQQEETEVQPTARVVQNRLQKMELLAKGIENGEFHPNPDAHRCATCPFNLICPA
jgi:DNA helicase-2/ATP-dependent DNA helicase PcrA